MKYAFFTANGDCLPIARRLELEGNKVVVGVVSDWNKTGAKKKEEPEEKRRRLALFDGILENKFDADVLLDKLVALKDKSDWFVACDFNHLYPYAEKLLAAGFKGLLPHRSDFSLEKDRQKAKQIVEKKYPELSVAECFECRDLKEAENAIEENEEMLFVLKGFSDEAKTLVPDSKRADVNHAEILHELKTHGEHYFSMGFILEELIPDLIEFTPEAIAFDGQVLGVNIDIELKDIGAGETGFQTGCTANLVFWQDLDGFLYKTFLEPLASFMLRPNELTIWDAAIAYSPSRQKFYFLEFCSDRWGYDAIFTQIATFPSATKYFETLVSKQPLYSPSVKKYGGAVRLFNLIPDSEHADLMRGDSWMCVDESDRHMWLWDAVKRGDDFFTVGYGSDLAIMTGAADDPVEALRNAYLPWDKSIMWTGAYRRPEFDVVDGNYATAILQRYSFGITENWFDGDYPDLMEGVRPPTKEEVSDEAKNMFGSQLEEAQKKHDEEIRQLSENYQGEVSKLRDELKEILSS